MNVLSCSHLYLVAGGVASSWSEDGIPNLGAPFYVDADKNRWPDKGSLE